MTYPELRQLIRRCLQKTGMHEPSIDPFIRGTGLPRAADAAGLDLWITRHPEDEDTKQLRSQLTHLHSYGKFDLVE